MKRAQAALEFLTTYGWAFLIILIMIGALAYFGVLSPDKYLPARCLFGPEIQCVEARLDSSTDTLNIRIRNNIGTTSDIYMNATYIGGTTPMVACVTNPGGAAFSDDLGNGRVQQFDCAFPVGVLPGGFPPREKVKLELTLVYQKSGGVFQVPVKGEVYVEVV